MKAQEKAISITRLQVVSTKVRTVYKLYLVLTNVDLSNGRQGEQVAMHLSLFILQRRQDQKQNDLLKTIKNTLSMAMVST